MHISRPAVALVAAIALAAGALTGCSGRSTSSSSDDPNVDVERSITYRTVDGDDLQLDACLPRKAAADLHAVVLVHGGAFQEGDRSNMVSLCKKLADAGFAGFAVDYRLVPTSYPAQVEDVEAAVAWLREPAQVKRFGLSTSAISIVGSSAGGIIGLSAAAALDDAGTPLSSVVTLSAAGDLTARALSLGNPSPDLEAVVLGYLGCDDIDDCATAADASPVTHAASLPPTLLLTGSDELIPIEQSNELTTALEDASVPHDLVVVDGSAHGLRLLNSSTLATITSFLKDHG